MKATAKQLQAIHAILNKRNLIQNKAFMIEGITAGRSSSSKDLTFAEAAEFIKILNPGKPATNVSSPMMSKLFAMCYEMGWITTTNVVQPDGSIKSKKDYSKVHAWVEKYGYLKKPLRDYSYKELPKLVTIFQIGPYKNYIDYLSKTNK